MSRHKTNGLFGSWILVSTVLVAQVCHVSSFLAAGGALFMTPNPQRNETSGLVNLGCYDAMNVQQLPTQIQSPDSRNPDTCSNSCLRRNFRVSLTKGILCFCSTPEQFKNNLNRVFDKYCDLTCVDAKVPYRTRVNTTCGGNFAYSVYCYESGNPKQSQGEISCAAISGQLLSTDSYEDLIQRKLNYTGLPLVRFECASPKIELNLSHFKTGSNYSPRNSPDSCALFCHRLPNSKYAALGSNDLYGRQESYCYCYTHEVASFWKPENSTNCNTTCPGNKSLQCGGTEGKYFTVYDIEHPNVTELEVTITTVQESTTFSTTIGEMTTTQQGTVNVSQEGRTASHTGHDDCPENDSSAKCKERWLVETEGRVEKAPKILNNDDAEVILNSITLEPKKKGDGKTEQTYTGPEITRILTVISTVTNRTMGNNLQGLENNTRTAVSKFRELVTQTPQWNELEANRSKVATKLLNTIEDSGFKFADALSSATTTEGKITSRDFGSKDHLQMTAGVVPKSYHMSKSFTFPEKREQNYIQLPNGWAEQFNTSEIKYVGTIFSDNVDVVYGSDLEEWNSSRVIKGKHVNSKMVSLTLQDKNSVVKFKDEGAQIVFWHAAVEDSSLRKRKFIRRKLAHGEKPVFRKDSTLCVHWNTQKGLWSDGGCKLLESPRSNSTLSTCECNHLTAFAVLVDVYDYVGSEPGLEILTFILCPIAVLCLMLAILLITKFSTSLGIRNVITINLCSCLLVANLMILFLVDRNYFYLNQTFCAISGAVTHYVLLCALSWMAMEGVLLYKMIIKVFNDGGFFFSFLEHFLEDYVLGQHLVCYGLPVLALGLNGLIGFLLDERPYGDDEFCYLNGNFIWSFIGPLAIIVTGNIIVLCGTLRVAYNRGKSTLCRNAQRTVSLMRCIRGSILISALLGVTWIAGFVMLINDYTVSTIGAYAFTILNASQGIVIFIFQLKSNEKLWGGLKDKVRSCLSKPFQKPDSKFTSFDWPTGSRDTSEDYLSLR